MKNNSKKQAALGVSTVTDPMKALWGAGTDVVGAGFKYGAPLMLGAPLALGFLLGKYRKTIDGDGIETAEELKREVLKRKYDDAILEAAKSLNIGGK